MKLRSTEEKNSFHSDRKYFTCHVSCGWKGTLLAGEHRTRHNNGTSLQKKLQLFLV